MPQWRVGQTAGNSESNEGRQTGVNYHQNLLQALKDGSPDTARQLMTEHMESAEMYALSCLNREKE